MLRPPPTPPLFPYTTLFRSDEVSALTAAFHRMRLRLQETQGQLLDAERLATIGRMASTISHDLRHPLTARSEEHTSELQSLTNLVCRLLLEKKNKREESVPL